MISPDSRLVIRILALLVLLPVSFAFGEPKTETFRVTGLFSPDRTDDLSALISEIQEIAMVNVDYEKAEAAFTFDDAMAPFQGANPEQLLERLNNLIRTASQGTFGILERCAIPREKLEKITIPIFGLDCKGCAFGAYSAIYQVDGVEQATASFKEGHVIAWIDPAKTDRAALEEALTKRRVPLKSAE